jgi:hypothetical protein
MFVTFYQMALRVITLVVHRYYLILRAQCVGSGFYFGPQVKGDLMWEVCWSFSQCPTAHLDQINLSPEEGNGTTFRCDTDNDQCQRFISVLSAAGRKPYGEQMNQLHFLTSCFLWRPVCFFIIRKSVTVYWICSLQSFKLECFIGLPSFELTKWGILSH